MSEFPLQNWVFDNISQPICQIDPQGAVVFTNQAFTSTFNRCLSIHEITLYRSDNTILNWNTFLPSVSDATISIRYHDGKHNQYFILKCKKEILSDSELYYLIFEEFTAKLRYKRLKAKRNLILRQAIDNYPIMLFGLDAVGKIQIWNKRAEILSGFQAVEAINKPINDFFPDYTTQIFEKIFADMKDKQLENLEQREIKFICKDNSIKHLLCMLRFDAQFVQGVYFFGILFDITEQIKAREALYKSEQRYYTISKATNDAIWDWNVHEDTIFWNEGITDIFGYSPDEVESTFKWWEQRIHEEDRQRVTEKIKNCVEIETDNWFDDYRFMRKDGSFAFVYDKGHILKDKNGKPIRMIGGMVDITERKIFEQNLLLKNRQLSEFAFFNSHKLRSPLARLMGIVHLLRSEDSLSPKETHELLERLIHSAEELDKMIRDMSNLLI
jgi:PAS domain S-box-containing protein